MKIMFKIRHWPGGKRLMLMFSVYLACFVIALFVMRDFPKFLESNFYASDGETFSKFAVLLVLIMSIVANLQFLELFGVLVSFFNLALFILLTDFCGAWAVIPIGIFNSFIVRLNPAYDNEGLFYKAETEEFTEYMFMYYIYSIAGYLGAGILYIFLKSVSLI